MQLTDREKRYLIEHFSGGSRSRLVSPPNEILDQLVKHSLVRKLDDETYLGIDWIMEKVFADTPDVVTFMEGGNDP